MRGILTLTYRHLLYKSELSVSTSHNFKHLHIPIMNALKMVNRDF